MAKHKFFDPRKVAALGRTQLVDMPLNGIGPAASRSGPNAYKDGTDNGLSLIRDRDEIYLRVRYTF